MSEITLNNKLLLIKELFSTVIFDKKTDAKIDSEGKLITRGFDVAYCYLFLDKPITKSDLRYINKIINKLVNILGTDWTMINKNYVSEKISYKEKKIFIPSDSWIRAYKDLLKIIVS